MMILPTFSPIQILDGQCKIDRKFHIGTCYFSEKLPLDIVVLAPKFKSDDKLMDGITIPINELPFKVELVNCNKKNQLDDIDKARVRELVKNSTFIYGIGFDTHLFASEFSKPFIPIIEYNLQTQIKIARLSVKSQLRKITRSLKIIWHFFWNIIQFKKALSIHCNGYPVMKQAEIFHQNCLMYLDSRMYENMVISHENLDVKLDSIESRVPRLVYSGRYEHLKGVFDVIDTGIELKNKGVKFELQLFGQGQLTEEMQKRVKEAGADDCIHVNAPIPYPELIKILHSSDIFICCHIQDDPSCTYLEALGSGLIIVGYDNKMWSALSQESKTGIVVKMGKTKQLTSAIADLLLNQPRLKTLAQRAREFALKHCYEREFAKRVEALLPLCEITSTKS